MATLVTTTRGLKSGFTESLFEQMSIVNNGNSEPIDLLTIQKTNSGVDRVQELSGITFRHVNNMLSTYCDDIIPKCDTWIDAYNLLDVSTLKSYKRIIIFGGALSNASGILKGSKRQGVFPYDHAQLKFKSTASQLITILACMKAHREYGIPLYEVVYDQQEFLTTYWHEDFAKGREEFIYFGYTDNRPDYNYKRLDSLQYHIEYNNSGLPYDTNPADMNKPLDLVFGYTVLTDSRKGVGEYVDSIREKFGHLFDKTEFYVKDKFSKIDTSLNREEYLSKIQLAKYTLIIPPYDESAISILRVVESLACGCLPLFQEGMNVKLLEESFDVSLSRLILNDSFIPLTEAERCDIIDILRAKFKFKHGLPE